MYFTSRKFVLNFKEVRKIANYLLVENLRCKVQCIPKNTKKIQFVGKSTPKTPENRKNMPILPENPALTPPFYESMQRQLPRSTVANHVRMQQQLARYTNSLCASWSEKWPI